MPQASIRPRGYGRAVVAFMPLLVLFVPAVSSDATLRIGVLGIAIILTAAVFWFITLQDTERTRFKALLARRRLI